MRDPFNLEPKNGDFASYIENLQAEELEALRRANPEAARAAQTPGATAEGGTSMRDLIAGYAARIRRNNTKNIPQSSGMLETDLRTDDEMQRAQAEALQARAAQIKTTKARRAGLAGNLIILVALGLIAGAMEGALPEPLIGFGLVMLFMGFVMTGNANKTLQKRNARQTTERDSDDA